MLSFGHICSFFPEARWGRSDSDIIRYYVKRSGRSQSSSGKENHPVHNNRSSQRGLTIRRTPQIERRPRRLGAEDNAERGRESASDFVGRSRESTASKLECIDYLGGWLENKKRKSAETEAMAESD